MKRFTTIVVDMSTVTYALLPGMNEYWDRLTDECDNKTRRLLWDKVLRAQLALLVNGSWLDGYLEVAKDRRQVVMGFDYKDENREYWRHQWLRDISDKLPRRKLKRRVRVFESPEDKVGKLVSEVPTEPINYKNGRNYTQNGLQRLKEGVMEQSGVFKCHRLSYRGYECDDIMATVVVVNSQRVKAEQHDLVLACNDSDILGLVNDRVTWFDLPRCHKPIVRANLEDINQWRVEVKREAELRNPAEMWAEKAIYGDTSDKLPPTGADMVTLPAIDLLNPPEQHRLWNRPEVREQVLSVLDNPVIMGNIEEKALAVLRMANVQPVFYNERGKTKVNLRG